MQINSIEEFRANIKPGDSYWPTYTNAGAPGGVGHKRTVIEYIENIGTSGAVKVKIEMSDGKQCETMDYLADLMNNITKRVFTNKEEAVAYNAEMERAYAADSAWQARVYEELSSLDYLLWLNYCDDWPECA